jgi:hypothetical protein
MIANAQHLATLAAHALRNQAKHLKSIDRDASASDALQAAAIFDDIASIEPGDPKRDHTIIVVLNTAIRTYNEE